MRCLQLERGAKWTKSIWGIHTLLLGKNTYSVHNWSVPFLFFVNRLCCFWLVADQVEPLCALNPLLLCVYYFVLQVIRLSSACIFLNCFVSVWYEYIAYLMYWELMLKPLLGDVQFEEWMHLCFHSCVYRSMLVLTYWVTSHNLGDFQPYLRQHTWHNKTYPAQLLMDMFIVWRRPF